MKRLTALLLTATIVVAACSDDDDGENSTTSSTTASTTTTTDSVPTFAGDPDSAFCVEVRSADDAPVLDPFATGLEPREVELRLRALRLRFGDFAEVAPRELEADLDSVVASLDELDALLDASGYDFAALAESGADISLADDPAFATIGTRLLAYREQVCDV